MRGTPPRRRCGGVWRESVQRGRGTAGCGVDMSDGCQSIEDPSKDPLRGDPLGRPVWSAGPLVPTRRVAFVPSASVSGVFGSAKHERWRESVQRGRCTHGCGMDMFDGCRSIEDLSEATRWGSPLGQPVGATGPVASRSRVMATWCLSSGLIVHSLYQTT